MGVQIVSVKRKKAHQYLEAGSYLYLLNQITLIGFTFHFVDLETVWSEIYDRLEVIHISIVAVVTPT